MVDKLAQSNLRVLIGKGLVAGMSATPLFKTNHNEDLSLKHSFTKTDLEQCSDGLLFGKGNAQLPASPLLMLDRIRDIQNTGGDFERGYAKAELDIHPSDWFFAPHFKGDPVMPGCLLIESMWQLTGFYLAWAGYSGKGRVLESGRTKFVEPLQKQTAVLSIVVHVRKLLKGSMPICITDGTVEHAGNTLCSATGIKIGLVDGEPHDRNM